MARGAEVCSLLFNAKTVVITVKNISDFTHIFQHLLNLVVSSIVLCCQLSCLQHIYAGIAHVCTLFGVYGILAPMHPILIKLDRHC